MTAPIAFLDACVLYPPVVRGCLLHTAGQGLIDPRWSPRALEEWARAAQRERGPLAAEAARDEARAMDLRWPGAAHLPDPEAALRYDLPDDDDVHILAAALAGGADYVVTFNLRDFPARKLRDLGLAPLSPDALLWEIAGRAPAQIEESIRRALAPLANQDPPVKILKRAHLPRLAKLVKTGALTP
ncbi:RSP_2648 family PIN domain-containing protein [Rhodovulum sp. DZ06]|uniref:RSP_2648 family PIN domain-containing protein n=1 Tax=Rhodovulum sp. DZ06 TaxID=3425126 RepID=UPI003D33142D